MTNIIDNYQRLKTLQRRSTLSLGNGLLASYAYGATDGRLATLDNGAATLEYSYVPGTNRLAKQEWTSGTPPSPLLTQEYGYDTYGRLTGITVNSTPEIAYTLDADSRIITTRKKKRDSGSMRLTFAPALCIFGSSRKP